MSGLEEKLSEYAETDMYPFHMPGHKRRLQAAFHATAFGAGAAAPENPLCSGVTAAPENPLCPAAPAATEDPLCSAARLDITEIDGFDNLHAPEGILHEEMKLAAQVCGAAETWFSVNGSTCAILAAISAAVPRNGMMLIERGCHISVYHAAGLRGLKLRYIPEGMAAFRFQHNPEGMAAPELQISHRGPESGGEGNTASSLKRAESEKISAVVITSPSYTGEVRDVRSWAEYAHALGAVLIVDEAHGAHFSKHPWFPRSAVSQGADLVVQSLHKTLPALTQTALLHRVTERVSGEALSHFLDVYETSSPSYLLLASMTRCIHGMAERGEGYFEPYVGLLKKLRSELSGLRHMRLAGSEDEIAAGLYDPGKLFIQVRDHVYCSLLDREELSGPVLYDLLRLRYHLQPEMKTPDSVLLMTSPADSAEGFERLSAALREIDRNAYRPVPAGSGDPDFGNAALPGFESQPDESGFPSCAMTITEAEDRPRETILLDEAQNRISASYVIVYPPDSPLIVPGEVFDSGLIGRIHALRRNGLTVTGLQQDASGRSCVRVIRERS